MYATVFCSFLPPASEGWGKVIFTARVRTYDGRSCFHRCVSVQLSGGAGGGYPIPSLGRGVPHPRSGQGGVTPSHFQGGTPSQVQGGYPIPCLGGGSPSQVQGGTPFQVQGQYPIPGLGGTLSQFQGGYPISGPGGYPIPCLGGTLSQVQGGTPISGLGGYSIPCWGRGYPRPPRIASTCYSYVAGSMPLAFMQEDFLVSVCPHLWGGGETCPRFGWVGGTPSQVWVGGYPIPGRGGVPHLRSGWLGGGYPIPGLDGGGYLGYPPIRSGWWGGGGETYNLTIVIFFVGSGMSASSSNCHLPQAQNATLSCFYTIIWLLFTRRFNGTRTGRLFHIILVLCGNVPTTTVPTQGLFTTRLRSTTRGYIFSLSVHSVGGARSGKGYPFL